MNQVLNFEVKRQYGNLIAAPVCQPAKALCDFAKRKVLSFEDVRRAKAIGFEVVLNGAESEVISFCV
jgi:hypothetical protein